MKEEQQQLSQKVETRRRENISRYFLSPRSTQFGLKVFSWQVPFASLRWAEFSVEFIFFFSTEEKTGRVFYFDQPKPTIISTNSLYSSSAVLLCVERREKRYVNETGLSLLDKIADVAALRWPIETHSVTPSHYIFRRVSIGKRKTMCETLSLAHYLCKGCGREREKCLSRKWRPYKVNNMRILDDVRDVVTRFMSGKESRLETINGLGAIDRPCPFWWLFFFFVLENDFALIRDKEKRFLHCLGRCRNTTAARNPSKLYQYNIYPNAVSIVIRKSGRPWPLKQKRNNFRGCASIGPYTSR